MTSLSVFITNVIQLIIQPILWLLFALALYQFVVGVGTYILKADDPKERAKGTQHMLWGVIGFFVMTSAILILRTITATFGVDLPDGN